MYVYERQRDLTRKFEIQDIKECLTSNCKVIPKSDFKVDFKIGVESTFQTSMCKGKRKRNV